ncbi:hypothetical protein AAF712_003969 [Marasmius tenuissimus]|uniref:Uncharacterized protein n=1 Tax=Marasmius tenuissimus TaxID=585030 RepID=A0ABR3A4R8_9AGAR
MAPKSPQDIPLYRAIDGRVGAWVSDGRYFITSPNSENIYMPLLGPREVFFRQDYRLGPEDPLLYPQPFLQDRCHYAAIPCRPSNPEHPRAKWWRELPPQAFVHQPDSAVTGLGRWSKEYLEPYEEDCQNLHERVSQYRTSKSSAQINPLVTALDGQLDRTFRHLTNMPLPLHRARLLWSYFQRWYLELLGALDWIQIYKPVMDGRVLPSETSRSQAAVTMGAFLTSVRDCELLFKVGIPFWLVRAAEHHPTARVDAQVVVTTPKSLNICVDHIMSHKKEILYHGPLRDLKKATEVERFGLAIVDFTNDPFSDPFEAGLAQPSTSSAVIAGPSRTTKKKNNRKQPCVYSLSNHANSELIATDIDEKSKARPPSQHQVERDKFGEIRGPFSPDIPDVWTDALAAIDRKRQPGKDEAVNRGYAFPEPGYVLNIPPEKMRRVVENWLRFRDVLMFRFMMHRFEPGPATTAWSPSQWKILLGTTEDYIAKEGSVMAEHEQRSIVKELLGKCLDFHGLTLAEARKSRLLTWRDHKYGVGQLTEPPLVKRIV